MRKRTFRHPLLIGSVPDMVDSSLVLSNGPGDLPGRAPQRGGISRSGQSAYSPKASFSRVHAPTGRRNPAPGTARGCRTNRRLQPDRLRHIRQQRLDCLALSGLHPGCSSYPGRRSAQLWAGLSPRFQRSGTSIIISGEQCIGLKFVPNNQHLPIGSLPHRATNRIFFKCSCSPP